MEEIRILKKQIENRYGFKNALSFAMSLYDAGYTEISAEIDEKILFLQQYCKELSSPDNSLFETFVAHYSLEDIKNRQKIYVKYTGKDICSVDNLAFSCEKDEAYISMLMEIGLNDCQINCVMKRIVEHGSIAKAEEDARKIVADLGIFELSEEVRNQFICDNADYLFNDYSREAQGVFENLCQKYGKEKGFDCLCEHPEYIRLGVKSIQ